MKALITQRIYHYEPYGELWECLDSELYAFLLECGIMGLGVSIQHTDIQRLFKGVEMLVLSGGNDLGEYPQRDKLEFALLEFALAHNKKVLGICRGMQVIAKYFGLELCESTHSVRQLHTLQGILNHSVRSYHRFCIHQAPRGFEVLACVGKEIEAMRNDQILGVMWHPERECQESRVRDVVLVREFMGLDSDNIPACKGGE